MLLLAFELHVSVSVFLIFFFFKKSSLSLLMRLRTFKVVNFETQDPGKLFQVFICRHEWLLEDFF